MILTPSYFNPNGTINVIFEPYVRKIRFNHTYDIVIYNPERFSHPLHLHGHDFWVVDRASNNRTYVPPSSFARAPIKRDTTSLPGVRSESSYLVLRFIANNPGVWFFHCV